MQARDFSCRIDFRCKAGQSPAGKSPGLGQVAQLQVGDAQGHAGIGVLGRNLQAAVQELYAFVELTEVHIAEAQVVKEIGIIGVLAEEFIQVDAGLVQASGGKELEGTGEVVLVGHEGSVLGMEGANSVIIVSRPGSELLKFWFEMATSLQRSIAGRNPPLLMQLQTKSR